MARRKARQPQKKWAIYPQKHDEVVPLLQEENLFFRFHEDDDEDKSIKYHDTCIMGRFICRNNSCSNEGWSSKKIAITIRLYPGQEYNARVYFQGCRKCYKLSRPILDESYSDRIAFRLKKWSGIYVAPPPSDGESKGPHESHLCEGCKNGHCKEFQYGD